MGEAGAQLSGSGNSAAHAAADGPLQPGAVQFRNADQSRECGGAGNIQHAIETVRSSRLRGGTDLQRALKAGLEQAASPGSSNTYLVILSDGGATRGPILNGKLAAWYASAWKQLPDTQRPRTYILAVGDDANLPLFRMLAQQDGVLEHVLSTEPMEFKLNSFLVEDWPQPGWATGSRGQSR